MFDTDGIPEIFFQKINFEENHQTTIVLKYFQV